MFHRVISTWVDKKMPKENSLENFKLLLYNDNEVCSVLTLNKKDERKNYSTPVRRHTYYTFKEIKIKTQINK